MNKVEELHLKAIVDEGIHLQPQSCAKVTEDISIGFAEWLNKNKTVKYLKSNKLMLIQELYNEYLKTL